MSLITNIPMEASGTVAPVTLVEVMTKNYQAPGAALPPISMDAPFAVPAGQALAWAFPTTVNDVGVMPGCGGIFCPSTGFGIGNAATRTLLPAGSLGYTQSRSFGNNISYARWSNFNLIPQSIPGGSIIHGIYPVLQMSAVSDRVFEYYTYGNNPATSLTATSEGSGFANPTPPAGSFSETEFYGASIGTHLSDLAGYKIKVLLNVTLIQDGLTELVTVTGVGFAIYYTPGPGGGSGADTSADDQLASGLFLWADHKARYPSLLLQADALYLDWLVGPQLMRFYGSTQTDTAQITVQNISGNTVERDISRVFTRKELIGALVVVRIWRADAETALITFIGSVVEVDADESAMILHVEGFGNWSAISAPSYDIDPSCPLTFGSVACGSTAPTPCDQTFGNCSSINRFAGVIEGWIVETPNQQLAQPAPAVTFNPARPF